MTTTLHELKTLTSYFGPMWEGDRTFDIRFDDRCFQKGDKVVLREWDMGVACDCRDHGLGHRDDCPRYTGRWLAGDISYVQSQTANRGSQRGFNGNGYVVLAILLFEASDPELTKELQS